jgi:DNA uptake protein ComE-like DNA-binding protein
MKLATVLTLSFAAALALASLAPAAVPDPARPGPSDRSWGWVPPATFVAAKDDKAPPLVDLNSAAKADLVKLPGLGDATADKIIAGRPWRSKYDLVVKKVVARSNYDKFARFVVARQASN